MTSLHLAQWWWFTRQLPQPKSGLFTRDIVWAGIILTGSSNPSCPVGDNNRPEALLHHAKSLLGDIWATRLPPRIANYTFLWPRHMQAFIHHPCTNHSAPSISAQTDWVWMLINTFCPVVAQGRIFSCCETGRSSVWAPYVTLVTSHKEWKLLPAWQEACPCRFLFPLQDFSSDDISGSVWLMRLSRDSLGSSCYLGALKTTAVFWK